MQKVTNEGAQALSRTLDRVANTISQHATTLGIPEKMAADFVHKMDIIADLVDKKAGFDAATIGQEQPGPVETVDTDEPFMAGEFSQQENRELREDQQAGQLGAGTTQAPRVPAPGKQALDFSAIGRVAAASRLASMAEKLKTVSGKRPALTAGLLTLTAKLMTLQAQIAEGTADAQTVQNALVASVKLLPILASGDEAKVAQGLKLASQISSVK